MEKKQTTVFAVALIVIAGLALFLIGNNEGAEETHMTKEINSFEDCVAAGFPVMESFPEQCATDDGKHFVREVEGIENPTTDNTQEPTPVVPDHSSPVACTAEALICPDGSGVGRTGPDCEFQACPNKEFFVGIVENDGGGNYIVVSDDYTIPVKFSVKNILGLFEGKEVRVFGEFIEGNVLMVETIEKYEPGRDKISIGETKNFNGVSITLNKVDDSRCPSDVTCVQAGTVTANVTLVEGSKTKTVDITYDDADGYSFYGSNVILVGVEPFTISTEDNYEDEDYILDFKVE